MFKYEKPDYVDIIVGCAKRDSEQMRILEQSLKDVDPGYPYNLIVVEGIRPVLLNRNEALEQTTSNYVFVCDDDTRFIQKNWLKDLLDVFEKYQDVGIVGCKIMNNDLTIVEHGGVVLLKYNKDDVFLKISQEFKSLEALREIDGICVVRKSKDDVPGIKTEYLPAYDKISPIWQVAGCAFLMDKRINGLFSNPTNGRCLEDLDMMAETIAKGYSVYYNGLVTIVNPSIKKEDKDKETINSTEKTNILPYFVKWGVF